MLLALLVAAILGILAGLITNAFDRTKKYAGAVGVGVAVIAFLVQLNVLG
jgi:hypothetical protein